MHVVTRFAVAATVLFTPLTSLAQTVPSADEIFARHVTAIGGKDAVLQIKSIHNSGKLEMPAMGISATMESASAPNRSFMRMTIVGIGDIKSGFDGAVAWEVNPMKGPRIKQDKEKILAQEDADFHGSMLFDKSRYLATETVGACDFGGEKTWQVKTVLKSGRVVMEYFSAATGLRVGSTSVQESQSGTVNVTVVESDYKQFGAVKLATRNEMTTGATKAIVTLTDVTLNDVSTNAFMLPEPVKALLIKQ